MLRAARTSMLPALTLLAACHVGPNFTRPQPPAVTRYTSDKLSIEGNSSDGVQHLALGKEIEGNWWSLFGSEAIDGIVKQSLEHNRTIQVAAQTLAQSQELAVAQAGLRYPQVGLTAGAGRQKYGAELFGGGSTCRPSPILRSARR